jgi:para-nitrobenzyl esterase
MDRISQCRLSCGALALLCMASIILLGMTSFTKLRVTEGVPYGQGYVRGESDGYLLKPLLYDRIEQSASDGQPRPAVILVHGGNFRGGSRQNKNLTHIAKAFARRGYVCFLIDYRLMDDAPPAPPPYAAFSIRRAMHAAYVDVKTALRHVHAHADDYGVDPERIALLGESAGAIAVLAAGVSDADVFAGDGPDFPVPAANNPTTSARAAAIIDFWGSAEGVLDKFDKSDPPIMIVHGEKDMTWGTLYASALNIVRACTSRGVPYRFHSLKKEGHGAWDAKVQGKKLPELSLDFLEAHLKGIRN